MKEIEQLKERIAKTDSFKEIPTTTNGCLATIANNQIDIMNSLIKLLEEKEITKQSIENKQVADLIIQKLTGSNLPPEIRQSYINGAIMLNDYLKETNERLFTEEEVKNALHKAELQHDRNYTGVWTNMLLYFNSLKSKG